MEFRSYLCPRYRKDVKFSSNLTKHINTYKILITLPSCQPSITALILEYNITNHLDMSTNNFKKDISPGVSNNGEKRIRLADIDNGKKDIKPVDIDEQKLATPN